MDHTRASDTRAAEPEAGIAKPLNVGNSRIRNSGIRLMETQIKDALGALLEAIKNADRQGIAGNMAKLEAHLEQGRETLHPQLVHFLANRSYAKAHLFLGGVSDIPVGVCGGRAGRAGS